MNDVSYDELVSALIDALEKQKSDNEANTVTVPEAMVLIGKGYRVVTRIMRQLAAEGVVEPAKVWRVDDWGDRQRIKGYRLIKEQGHVSPTDDSTELA